MAVSSFRPQGRDLADWPEAVESSARVSLLGVPVDNLTMDEAVRWIVRRLDSDRFDQVCFVNAHCVNTAFGDAAYRDVLRRADLVLADGIGMKLAGLALGTPVRDNVNGTDLFPRLCQALEGTGKRLFLLGARPGVADRVREWVNRQFPEVILSGCHHGYFSPRDELAVTEKIADSGADVLLVAFGVPRQDLWIDRHRDALGVRVGIGVGGLFDFYSGRIPRAPVWMRRAGMEWFYRLCREPGRLARRYVIGNPLFLARVASRYLRPRAGGKSP